jgi:DNA (cytosine-5)-methyltransferase 1
MAKKTNIAKMGNESVVINTDSLFSKVSAIIDEGRKYVATAVDCRNATENPNVNGTLQAKEQGQNLNSNNVCRTNNVVRRLTPKECERLQNFPDLWTSIGDWVDSKGKLHKGDADSPRYKALGNSIALPFWDWLLGRISAQYDRPATLGSLFDGIGGFPLCWEKHNGKGTALWASEIEEFPIAVTKLRFPENDDGEDRSD